MNSKKDILNFMEAFPDEESCVCYFENLRWGGKVISPFDPASKVYKCANGKYKCRNTGKYFNVKTRTVFESTKLPLRLGCMRFSYSCRIKEVFLHANWHETSA